MLGLMQEYSLQTTKLLTYAETYHGDQEIVSKRLEGDMHRISLRDMAARTRKLAKALTRLGVQPEDCIGTIAFNGYRHMEIYFGVPGMGAVYHTMNPRLSPEQLIYVINHAEDKYIFVEAMFLPLIEAIKDHIPGVKGFILLIDKDKMPETSLDNVICYEDLIGAEDDDFDWPEWDENRAIGLCYTSGTTGNPKGVLYSHRSTVLHALLVVAYLELTNRDVVLPIVPMFHVNGWSLPFVSMLLGMKLIMPGKDLDGASIYELCREENVTLAAGVPTVAKMLLDHMGANDGALPNMQRFVIGGSAVPRAMLDGFDAYGITALQAWGMTETSSMGTGPSVTPKIMEGGKEGLLAANESQGRGVFGVEMKIVDEAGAALPHDGDARGALCVKGPCVASAYYKSDSSDAFLEGGWFETGDIATIDTEGTMRIVDRSKDVIKSGGEWISSIDLENAAMGAPGVGMAAVIAAHHPKWDERPLLVVAPKPGETPDKDAILAHMAGQITKWWMPDDVAFVDEIPLGATGKVNKLALRKTFEGYTLPTA